MTFTSFQIGTGLQQDYRSQVHALSSSVITSLLNLVYNGFHYDFLLGRGNNWSLQTMLLLGGRKEEETYSGGRNPRALHPLYETKLFVMHNMLCHNYARYIYVAAQLQKIQPSQLFALVNMIELQLVVEIERGLSLQPCCTTIQK